MHFTGPAPLVSVGRGLLDSSTNFHVFFPLELILYGQLMFRPSVFGEIISTTHPGLDSPAHILKVRDVRSGLDQNTWDALSEVTTADFSITLITSLSVFSS